MSLTRRSLIQTAAGSIAASTLPLPAISSARQTPAPKIASPIADTPGREDRILAAMEAHGIPGAIILLDSPETGLWKSALGVADIETGEPMTTDMHMRIGSITKTFTATMILQLVDQDTLAMDDTLAALLPDQADLPNAESITLRHLLAMQSGLPEYVGLEGILDAGPDDTRTDDDIIALIRDMDAEFSPGERSMYSNTNYILLGMIAEAVTGSPWQELIQTGIIDAAGLAETSVPTGTTLPEPSPRGYVYDLDLLIAESPSATPDPQATPTDMTEINPAISGAAGNMISTVDDLQTWMRVLQDGSLLSPELQADRLDFSDEGVIESASGGMSYGLGLFQKNGAIGHDGGINGFRSSMLTWPETETTLIILTNVIPARDGQDPAAIVSNAVLGQDPA